MGVAKSKEEDVDVDVDVVIDHVPPPGVSADALREFNGFIVIVPEPGWPVYSPLSGAEFHALKRPSPLPARHTRTITWEGNKYLAWFMDLADTPHALHYNVSLIRTHSFPQLATASDRDTLLRSFMEEGHNLSNLSVVERVVTEPLVPGTFFARSIVESHEQLVTEATRYVLGQGIQSNLAIYLLVRTTLSKAFGSSMTLEKSTALWRNYRVTFVAIDAEIRRTSQDDNIGNTKFAVSVMMHLKFPKGQQTYSACPYAIGAQNFIIALFTHQCLCSCYTGYVVAAAEEVGRGCIIPLEHPGHMNIGILDSTRTVPIQTIPALLDGMLWPPGQDKLVTYYFRDQILRRELADWESVHPLFVVVDAGSEDNDKMFVVSGMSLESTTQIQAEMARGDIVNHVLFRPWMSPRLLAGRVGPWNGIKYALRVALMGTEDKHWKREKRASVDRTLFELVCIGHVYDFDVDSWVALFMQELPEWSLQQQQSQLTAQTDKFFQGLPPTFNFILDLWNSMVDSNAALFLRPFQDFAAMEPALRLRQSLANPSRLVDITSFACEAGRAKPTAYSTVVLLDATTAMARPGGIGKGKSTSQKSLCREFLEDLMNATEFEAFKADFQWSGGWSDQFRVMEDTYEDRWYVVYLMPDADQAMLKRHGYQKVNPQLTAEFDKAMSTPFLQINPS